MTHKSYSFYCDDLNDGKLLLLRKKAEDLLVFKNEISLDICKNPVGFLTLDKFDCVTKYRTRIDSCNNQDISNAIEHVFTSYDNKRQDFIRNLNVKIQKEFKIERYKVNTKNHKIGETKSFETILKSTELTTVVSYLSKYYNENIIEYLRNNKSENVKQQKLRELVLSKYDKYGDRLLKLCVAKQSRVINSVFEHGITFDSLSFTSCTEQKQQIIERNKTKGSVYGAVITIPGQKTDNGKLSIPVKYSKKYHGSLTDYHKQPTRKGYINTTYTVVFENNKVRFVLTKEVDEKIVKNKTKYYGIDVNIKHNMYADKYGFTIDYDRDMVNEYIDFLKQCDIKLSNKPKESRTLSNKDKKVKAKWQVRIEDMLKRQSSLLVNHTKEQGFNHLVMEDLGSFAKSFTKNDELKGFKYSRLCRLLNLSNLKNIVSSIASKNNVQVSFIQPAYTSSACKCGCVDKRNRVEQEKFKCVSCGLEAPADAHSSDMIEDRLRVDVLRKALLNEVDGTFVPKIMKRSTIKKILQECYDNRQQ
jgi:transposase